MRERERESVCASSIRRGTYDHYSLSLSTKHTKNPGKVREREIIHDKKYDKSCLTKCLKPRQNTRETKKEVDRKGEKEMLHDYTRFEHSYHAFLHEYL